MWQVAALSPYLDVCGVQRVVVSAPVKEPSVLNVVVGVNDDKLTSDHVICTAAGQSATASKPMRPPAAHASARSLRVRMYECTNVRM